MTNEKEGGPAFPSHEAAESDYRNRISGGGMSLRDYFAAKAMQGMFASDTDEWNEQGDWESRAKSAYNMADAMLKAREQT